MVKRALRHIIGQHGAATHCCWSDMLGSLILSRLSELNQFPNLLKYNSKWTNHLFNSHIWLAMWTKWYLSYKCIYFYEYFSTPSELRTFSHCGLPIAVSVVLAMIMKWVYKICKVYTVCSDYNLWYLIVVYISHCCFFLMLSFRWYKTLMKPWCYF